MLCWCTDPYHSVNVGTGLQTIAISVMSSDIQEGISLYKRDYRRVSRPR